MTIQFNLSTLTRLHRTDAEVTLHPSWRDLGDLKLPHELTAALFINDEFALGGMHINAISYNWEALCRSMGLPKEYKVQVSILRGDEVVAQSFPMEMRACSKFTAQSQELTVKATGLEFLNTFLTALVIMRPRYLKSEHAEVRTLMLATEVGPWMFELYWNMDIEDYEFSWAPSNDIENIRLIPMQTENVKDALKYFLPALDSKAEEWLYSGDFRQAIIEEPLTKDLKHHYTLLMALCSANNPLTTTNLGLRAFGRASHA